MSDLVMPADGMPVEVEPVTAGRLLRKAREASGLHVAALAVSIKVPVRKLEALEADRLDELPDAVFARALASSVCRVLKIDAKPVLALLPNARSSLVSLDEAGINTPFHGPGDTPTPSALTLLPRWVVIGVLLLLIAAAAVAIWPVGGGASGGMAVRKVGEPSANPQAPVAPIEMSTLPSVVELPPSDNPRGPDVVSTVPNATTTPSVPAAPANTAPPSGAMPMPAAPVPTATSTPSSTPFPGVAAAAGTVSFSASGTAWIEVIDAKGQVALRKTLAAGESAGANGTPPFMVTLGRADLTHVKVRGKDFAVSNVTRDNVARFEVK